MVGHAEAIVNRYLLSGLLACGAHSDAPGRKPFCGSPLKATTRGPKQAPSYICAGHREKGDTFCTNTTGIPMGALHRAVIDALKVTFSEAKFEDYLRDQAANAEQVAARRAERENLLQQVPKLAAAEAKLAKVIAITDDVDALVAELKATQQERRQAEAGSTSGRPGPARGGSPGFHGTMAPCGAGWAAPARRSSPGSAPGMMTSADSCFIC